jgi:hypothetical protein
MRARKCGYLAFARPKCENYIMDSGIVQIGGVYNTVLETALVVLYNGVWLRTKRESKPDNDGGEFAKEMRCRGSVSSAHPSETEVAMFLEKGMPLTL